MWRRGQMSQSPLLRAVSQRGRRMEMGPGKRRQLSHAAFTRGVAQGPPCSQLLCSWGSLPWWAMLGTPPSCSHPTLPGASAEHFLAPLSPLRQMQPFQAATKASRGTQRRGAEERPGFK